MRNFTKEEQKKINKVFKPTGYNIYGKHELTPEEKELIVNTPITFESFDMVDSFSDYSDLGLYELGDLWKIWNKLIMKLEAIRVKYLETKDECYFIELIRLLPNSYKAVKL